MTHMGQVSLGGNLPPIPIYVYDERDTENGHPGGHITKHARIPWLEKPGAVKFEQTEMFTKILTGDSAASTQAKRLFYDVLNEIFPHYLPKRYHAMDCKSLAKCSADGAFWKNAAFSVFCNQAYTPVYYKPVMVAFNTARMEAGNLLFRDFGEPKEWLQDDTSSDNWFKDGIEESASAEEFLLEPWVLVQLPFQPVLFHQWTVAVLAEALRLQRDIADLYTMAVPRRLGDAIAKLFSVTQQLLDFAFSALASFFEAVGDASLSRVALELRAVANAFERVLPLVRFVVGAERRTVIRALKRLAWSGRHEQDRIIASMDAQGLDTFHSYLNRSVWERFEHLPQLVSLERLPAASDESPTALVDKFNSVAQAERLENCDALKKLVSEKILRPGRLKGAPHDKILDSVHALAPKLQCFHDLHAKYIGTSTEKGSSTLWDGGIILDLVNLQSDVKVAEALGLLTQHIQHHVSSTCGPEVYIDAGDSKAAKMSHEEIVEALDKVRPSDEWSFQSVLARLKASLPHVAKFDRKLKLAKILQNFEHRIKHLVFRMIEQQFQSSGNCQVERQFVQYMLPCFVASISILDKSLGKSKIADLVALLHEFILGYEEKQFVVPSPWNPTTLPYSEFSDHFCKYHDFFANECRLVFRERVRRDGVAPAALDALERHLFFSDAERKMISDTGHFFHFGDVYLLLTYLMQSRLRLAMERVKWCCDFRLNIGHILQYSFLDMITKTKTPFELLQIYHSRPPFHCLGVGGEGSRLVAPQLLEAAKALSQQQLLGVALFLLVKSFREHSFEPKKLQLLELPFDTLGTAIASVYTKDWWKLKQIVAPHLKGADPLTDLSLVSLQQARQNACYAEALKKLTPKGKLFMKEPGEATFFPVRHCRWCGVTALEHFRLCPECEDEPDYPDTHFFCSEKCEAECLAEKHIEEHARYEMVKLRISN